MSIVGTLFSNDFGAHNLFEYVQTGREPGQRLLRHWNKRDRSYGRSNYGMDKIDKFTGPKKKKGSAPETLRLIVGCTAPGITTLGLARRTAKV